MTLCGVEACEQRHHRIHSTTAHTGKRCPFPLGHPCSHSVLVLQPNRRLPLPNLLCRRSIPCTSQIRMQHLRLLQVLHNGLRQTRGRILRNRTHQKNKRRQQIENGRLHLLPLVPASSRVPRHFHRPSICVPQGCGFGGSLGDCRLQRNDLA